MKTMDNNHEDPVKLEHMERHLSNTGYLGASHALFDRDRKPTETLSAGGYLVYGNYYGVVLCKIDDDMSLTPIEIES